MANLKSLAKDTAIYGLSSIVGRFLNYLLVPLYTARLAASSGGYGVITEVYSYTALLLVLLTFGMETTFFRFVNKEGGRDPMRVYSTTLIAVGGVGVAFVALVMGFLPQIAAAAVVGRQPRPGAFVREPTLQPLQRFRPGYRLQPQHGAAAAHRGQ